MSKSSSTASGRHSDHPVVRYAVVGLGHIAQTAVLPGFLHAKRNSRVTALVSDDPEKSRILGKKYKVDLTYGYDQYDECLRGGGIDAVYIALPNDLHAEYAIRAARAGIHVLCEKPMAVTGQQCQDMIASAKDNHVRLMIAYRLHFERTNLRAITLAAMGRLGDLRFFNSTFSMMVKEGDIRTRPLSEGGGSVYDLGIYCINAARYLFRDEPIQVLACSAKKPGDPRFSQADEMTAAVLRFPGERLATFVSSFGASSTAAYDLVGTEGSLRIEQAYEYSTTMKQILTIDEKPKTTRIPIRDQFAAEIDYFSQCILDHEEPEPSGEEGLADVRIIQAILDSARSGRSVHLEGKPRKHKRPDIDQEIEYPPAPKPETVNAESPTVD